MGKIPFGMTKKGQAYPKKRSDKTITNLHLQENKIKITNLQSMHDKNMKRLENKKTPHGAEWIIAGQLSNAKNERKELLKQRRTDKELEIVNTRRLRKIVLPPVKSGFVRLYRGEDVSQDRDGDGLKNISSSDSAQQYYLSGSPNARGRWFTNKLDDLDFYIADNPNPRVVYTDVPKDVAEKWKLRNIPKDFSVVPTRDEIMNTIGGIELDGTGKEMLPRRTPVVDFSHSSKKMLDVEFFLPKEYVSAKKQIPFTEQNLKDIADNRYPKKGMTPNGITIHSLIE